MEKILTFTDRQAFREWLGKYGTESDGVWLLFGKKGKFVTLSAAEALEEALCHGWIDGQMQSIDDNTTKSILHAVSQKANGLLKTKSWHKLLWKRG